MTFTIFTLLTDEQARQMAEEERNAKPVHIEPPPIKVQDRPEIHRYRSKKVNYRKGSAYEWI